MEWRKKAIDYENAYKSMKEKLEGNFIELLSNFLINAIFMHRP